MTKKLLVWAIFKIIGCVKNLPLALAGFELMGLSCREGRAWGRQASSFVAQAGKL